MTKEEIIQLRNDHQKELDEAWIAWGVIYNDPEFMQCDDYVPNITALGLRISYLHGEVQRFNRLLVRYDVSEPN